MTAHVVELVTNGPDGQARAECRSCSWSSPWRTRRSAWDDGPDRTEAEMHKLTERVAVWHIYETATR